MEVIKSFVGQASVGQGNIGSWREDIYGSLLAVDSIEVKRSKLITTVTGSSI